MSSYRLEVRRDDFATTRLTTLDAVAVADGQVLLEIEKFALTANNVTYAVAGDLLSYWQFFPCDEGWGCIPVWAVGKVTASAVPGVEVGQRYFGYYPMASQLCVEAQGVSGRGFVDGSAHRAKLPLTYNQYILMTEENGFPADQDEQKLVYRPLFTTAFLIDDFLWDNEFFDAQHIVIGSASSKTAIATAFCLAQRQGLQLTALTSASNKAFVESLGLYHAVFAYDEVENIAKDAKTVYVDMSGNSSVLSRVHHHLGDQLSYSCAVGITHYDAMQAAPQNALPGAAPQMFFAPTQVEKRNADWGSEEFFRRLDVAWQKFMPLAAQHIEIVEKAGVEELQQSYSAILQGGSPNQAFVCRP